MTSLDALDSLLTRAADWAKTFHIPPHIWAGLEQLAATADLMRRFPSRPGGYVPYFEARGQSPEDARFTTAVIHLVTDKGWDEWNVDRRESIKAIRKLASSTTKRTIMRRAADLQSLGLYEDLPVAFSKARCLDLYNRFSSLLQEAARGEEEAALRVQQVARQILPHLPQTRGRRRSRATAMHQVFLEARRSMGMTEVRYSVKEDVGNQDPETLATRVESGDANFTPKRTLNVERTIQRAMAELSLPA